MKQLYVRLQAVSPLSIRADHAPGSAATMRYIPGTAFAGSLAAIHRLLHPERSEEFERLFLHEQVFYPNLYPAVFGDDTLQNRNVPVLPLPKTARSCKRHLDFLYRGDNPDHDGHGARDSLIDWALFALGSHELLRQHKWCEHKPCRAEMDHFDGYYRRDDNNPDQISAARPERYIRLHTHTGIHRASGIVQENILYNREVFEEGMLFWGLMKVDDNAEGVLTQLQDFVAEADREELVHIGTGRSRGMGRVRLEIRPIDNEQERFENFKKRLHAFNKLVHEQVDVKLHGLEDHYFFAITLHSPLILCDDLLRYRGTIDTAAFAEMLGGRSIPGLQRICQVASTQRVTGWQELWGMPRTNEYAIETGSVFLFMCSSQPDDDTLNALFELEERGAGKRRTEGFGQLCISDQFHREIEPL